MEKGQTAMMHAIDTQILLWAIKRVEPGREAEIARAVSLVEDLTTQGIAIMIPSIVLAEYLVFYDPAEQPAQSSMLRKNFFVAPFDPVAAEIAAELYSQRLIAQAREETGQSKHALKADVKIIATAIAHRANCIYSHDGQFESFARGRIAVCGLPELPRHRPLQRPLFDLTEPPTGQQ